MRNRGNTIRDVASAAGVSIGTVSKVFNHNGRIAETTREHVLKVATELHFKPNALIRSLRGGQTHTIGVFTWDYHEDPTRDVTMALARGIAAGISLAQYDMVTYSHLPERTPEVMASIFMDGRIDGVVIGPMDVNDAGLSALAEAGFPTVTLYRRDVPEGIGTVTVDNASGVTQAVQYLMDLGHRCIAYYAPMVTIDYREREQAYRQVLQANGITPEPQWVFFGEEKVPSIATAAAQFFGLPEPPTAVIAGDDDQALRWMAELRQRGLHVPEEVSVIGFDDVAASESHGLTTIRQPAQEIGRQAAHFVKAIIDGTPATECHKVFPVELIVRRSTGPVP